MSTASDRMPARNRVHPIDLLVDPTIRDASRLLSRRRYPLFSLDDLPEGAPGALLREHLGRRTPLFTLRQALEALQDSLQAPPPLDYHESPSAPLAPDPSLLAGTDPSSRAARIVYRALLEQPDLAVLGRARARRIAFVRAFDFRAMCNANLPHDAFDSPAGRAALHAFAQAYAREFVSSGQAAGPSPRCHIAAAIARTMFGRLAWSDGEWPEAA